MGGLAAQFEIVECGAQFEQSGTLAAGEFACGVDVGVPGGWVGVGVGAMPE
jgi:hypothetical protein